MALNFPQDWPEDCPPVTAVDAAGEVFRLVKSNPVTAEDMSSHKETGKLLKAPACLRCGLSVFRELEDAIHQRRLIPKLGDFVATATLDAAMGKTLPTAGRQPTHTTWWPYEGIDRASLFSIVAEER